MVEPWLRGTLTEYDAVRRQVLHALELAGEDVTRWCHELDDAQMNARPLLLPSVAFHLVHIVRSSDRLLTYAEGRELSDGQLQVLSHEGDFLGAELVLVQFAEGLLSAGERVRLFDPATYAQVRGVGRQRLPSTVGGLLIHLAEHTQRHIGQAITTARVVRGMRLGEGLDLLNG